MRITSGHVRRERGLLGLTVRQLAAKSQLPVCDIVEIESGAIVDVPELKVLQLASALGLEPVDLSEEELSEREAGLFSC